MTYRLHFIFLMMMFIITSNTESVHASVWESTQDWDSDFEEKFSQWIESNSVHPQLFTSPKSPYGGVSLDCADVMYSLRAIFAYENKLPYQVKNPVATAKSKTQFFTNQMSLWDNLPESLKVKRFLTYLSSSLGTETLSLFDSYSPEIKSP